MEEVLSTQLLTNPVTNKFSVVWTSIVTLRLMWPRGGTPWKIQFHYKTKPLRKVMFNNFNKQPSSVFSKLVISINSQHLPL